MLINSRGLTVGCCLLGLVPLTGFTTEEADDRAIERCISIRAIDRTDVVDDNNILFYMRNGDVYLNRLPHRCPGLKRERTFMYRTTMPRLCDVDIITVLDQAGFGFMPGASCGLGRFYPISEDEAKALKEPAPKDIEAQDVPPAEPEPMDDED
jgi:hypothetical protein